MKSKKLNNAFLWLTMLMFALIGTILMDYAFGIVGFFVWNATIVAIVFNVFIEPMEKENA